MTVCLPPFKYLNGFIAQKENAISFCIRSYSGEWATDKKSQKLLFLWTSFNKTLQKRIWKTVLHVKISHCCFCDRLKRGNGQSHHAAPTTDREMARPIPRLAHINGEVSVKNLW